MFPLRDENHPGRLPVLCLLLILANLATYLFELSLGPDDRELLYSSLGVVPALASGRSLLQIPSWWPWLTLVSSTFLHASWLHVLGNLWFLWVFGDNVEDLLGRVLFLPFYFACGAVAAVAQIVSDPSSAVPTIGASGAIAGVLGTYFVMFPRAQVQTLVVFFFYVRVVPLPAVLFLGLWALMQFTGLLGPSGVAWWAHLGGFAAGIVVGVVLRLSGRGGRGPGRHARRTLTPGQDLYVRLPTGHS